MSDYIKELERLREKLYEELLSVMVGSGFSKNANNKFPDWFQLLSNLAKVLYSDEILKNYKLYNNKKKVKIFANLPKKFIENELNLIVERETSLGIVSQYIKKFGYKEVITSYIEDEMLAYDKSPDNFLDLHKQLLDLRWNNVYTTNYDSLLEQADQKRTTSRYKPVKKAEELSIGTKQRIIKLHGCFYEDDFDGDIRTKYIISKEDYDEYPKKHEAFTQLMRISLLQESFCLIGFSGDDPNFLAWIEWIRDILSKTKNDGDGKIYILDVKDEDKSSPGKKLFYKNLRIKLIPLFAPEVFKYLETEVQRIKNERGDLEALFDDKYKKIFQMLFIYLSESPQNRGIGGKHKGQPPLSGTVNINPNKPNISGGQEEALSDKSIEFDNISTDVIKDYERTLESLMRRFNSFQKDINLDDIILLYNKLKSFKISSRIPTVWMISNTFSWGGWLLNYIKKTDDIHKKVKLFGLLSLSIQNNLMFLSYYYFGERLDEIFKEFNSINFSELNNDEKEDYKSFIHLILRDSSVKNNQKYFERWSEILLSLEPDDNDKNLITYYRLYLYAINFYLDKLENGLENWKPEENNDLPIHWLVKKAGLLCIFKDEKTEKAYQMLIENQFRLKNENIQEQLYFYEQLSFIESSIHISFGREKNLITEKKEMLEKSGLSSVQDVYKYLLNWSKREEKIKPFGEDRYIYINSSGGWSIADDVSNGFRIINLLFESGIPLKTYSNLVFINQSEWWSVFNETYKYLPDITLFYSYQFSGNDANEDFFRSVAQRFVQNDNLKDFMPTSFNRMEFTFKYLLEREKLNRASLFFISQILDSVPYSIWAEFFNYFWEKFNNNDKLKKLIYFDQGVWTLDRFIEQSIELIEDVDILKKVLHDILIIKNQEESSKLNYLAYLISNHFFRKNIKAFRDKETRDILKKLINEIDDNFEFNLKSLNNVSELLIKSEKSLILNKLNNYFQNKNKTVIPDDLVHVLFNFSKDDEKLKTEFKELLLQQRLWYTGITITDENSYSFAPASIIHLNFLRKNGLDLNPDEIKIIYEQLKKSVRDIIFYEEKCNEQFGNFNLVQEMWGFLKDDYQLLNSDNEYNLLLEKLSEIYKRSIEEEKIYLSLSSEDPNKVIKAVGALSNQLFIGDTEGLDISFNIVFNKVILKNEPKLEACIGFLADILPSIKEKNIFSQFIRYYEIILEKYFNNIPENTDKVFIQKNLIKIALTLNKLNIHTSIVDEWIKLKENSRFSSIRNMILEDE